MQLRGHHVLSREQASRHPILQPTFVSRLAWRVPIKATEVELIQLDLSLDDEQ